MSTEPTVPTRLHVRRRAARSAARGVVVLGSVVCAAIGVLSACGTDDGDVDGMSGSLVVSASGSVGAAMEEIAAAFGSTFDGVDVSVNIANSAALAGQINQGAPVDVFAAADPINMQTVVDGVGTIAAPVRFATNEPRILVAPGNPFGVTTLADLADPGLVVVAVTPEAAIGRYVTDILERAGVALNPVSYEQTPTAAANKVVLGEADATIVFVTDVIAAGDGAEGVAIPAADNTVTTNLIAILAETTEPVLAEAFVEFVLGATGQAILASYGFGAP